MRRCVTVRKGAGQVKGAPRRILMAAAVVLAAGCANVDEVTVPEGGAVFVLEVGGEEFTAIVADPEQVQALQARMTAGVEGVVSGRLVRGNGGFNAPWGWHWDPETVHVADVSIELCDGRPSMVDEDLDYWVDTVGYFCPWGAKVVRRQH